jgi:DNA-binding MarR family transcriptional regulator
MSRAASNFLQGANAANAAAAAGSGAQAAQAAPTVDDADVLLAVGRLDSPDLGAVASRLGVVEGAVEPTVDKLARQGLVDRVKAKLTLSKAGERALRYMDLASF